MGMPHGKILVHSISDITDPTTRAPWAGPERELGRLALQSEITSLINISSESGATSAAAVHIIDEIDLSEGYNGASWLVVIGSNGQDDMRSSHILAVWNDYGSGVSFTETSTVDIGNTDDVTMTVTFSGSTIRLNAVIIGSQTWNIKTIKTYI